MYISIYVYFKLLGIDKIFLFIYLPINPSCFFASHIIIGCISLSLLFVLLERLLVIFWPKKKVTKSVALFLLQFVILQLLKRWQCVSELQLSPSHRKRLLNSHDMVKKDIVSDVTGAAIPKLETIFCALNHDQTQKNGLKGNTCSFQKFGNKPRSFLKYGEHYGGIFIQL